MASPYIPNLTVGAEVYGLTGQTSSQAGFDTVQASGGPQAVGAMMLLDRGPSGFDHNWDGYDMLLMSNFGGYDFENPVLGLGSQTLSAALQQRGWELHTDFGGSGPEILSILGSGSGLRHPGARGHHRLQRQCPGRHHRHDPEFICRSGHLS